MVYEAVVPVYSDSLTKLQQLVGKIQSIEKQEQTKLAQVIFLTHFAFFCIFTAETRFNVVYDIIIIS